MNRTDRMALMLLGGALLLGLLAGVSLWFAGDTDVLDVAQPTVGSATQPPGSVPEPVEAAPEPVPDAPQPAEPEGFREQAPEPMTPDVKRDFNYAMHDVVKESRFRCFTGWVEEEGMDASSTLVLDAVFEGGDISDISIRGLSDVPEDVLECVREVAWEQEWPPYAGGGETRFQRTFPLLEPQAR